MHVKMAEFLSHLRSKSKVGANAILAVSMAVCRAGAAASGMPLYQYIVPGSAASDTCLSLDQSGRNSTLERNGSAGQDFWQEH